jgi:hypothetical protein
MADRIEREIEEILKKLDNFVPERTHKPVKRMGQPLNAAQSWFAHRLARISLKQVMMWSLFVVLVSFFMMRGFPGAMWIMVGALIVFATAFVLSRSGGGSQPQSQKRWRGQPIDLSGPAWPDRVKAWLKGRRRV